MLGGPRCNLLVSLGLASLTSCAGQSPTQATPAAQSTLEAPAVPDPVARVDGARVHYLSVGSGEPVIVLVHGWASDSRVWRFQLDSLGKKMRVLAVDLPGHGASEPAEVPHSMELYVRGVAAVMDDAGVEKAVLVGHSNGAPVVREFYRRYPGRTRGLVMVDGALRQMVTPQVIAPFLERLRSDQYEDAIVAMVDSMPAPNLSEQVKADIRVMAGQTSQAAAIGGLEAAVDPDTWTPDPIEVPLMLVLAEQPAWSDDYEAFVRELAPQVDYRVWLGVSHFLMMERPVEFDAALMEFFVANHWLDG